MRDVLGVYDMPARKRIGATQIDNDRISVNKLHSFLWIKICDAGGFSSQLHKDDQKKAAYQGADEQYVIAGEF